MIVYAESSAVLSWLLGEPGSDEIRQVLEAAEFVVASDLTLIECDRVLHRAECLKELDAAQVEQRRNTLRRAASNWVVLRISAEIVGRSREPFPEEPIRSLDAIHLASALYAVDLIPEAMLLALDKRVRRSAQGLGLSLLPVD